MEKNEIKNIWIFSLLIKILIGVFLPLSADEAYYWFWSHNMQLSFFDHPPFVAWLFWAGQPLEEFFSASRLPGILMGHCTLLIWLEILKPFLKFEQRKWWLYLMLLAPLTGPGSIIITPDIPLLFFWSLGILVLLKAFTILNPKLFITLGVILGLGFVSKYTIVLFAPFALIWAYKEKKLNAKSTPLILLSIIVFFVAAWPVWLWNAQNDFISFKFQLGHGLKSKSWNPYWPLLYVLGQFFLIFPTILYRASKKEVRDYPKWLSIFSWGPLIFFFITSFKGRVEVNWPLMAYPSLIALAVYGTTQWRWAKYTLGVWAALFIVAISQAYFAWLPMDPALLKTHELRRYETLVEKTKDIPQFYAANYQMAGKLSFEQKRKIYKLKSISRIDFFDFKEESVPTKSPFILATIKGNKLPRRLKNIGYRVLHRQAVDDEFELLTVEIKNE